jgi:hypothetical protein
MDTEALAARLSELAALKYPIPSNLCARRQDTLRRARREYLDIYLMELDGMDHAGQEMSLMQLRDAIKN